MGCRTRPRADRRGDQTEIAPLTDVSESTVRGILPRLVELRTVAVDDDDGPRNIYTLDTAGIEKIVRQHRQRQEMETFREQVSET